MIPCKHRENLYKQDESGFYPLIRCALTGEAQSLLKCSGCKDLVPVTTHRPNVVRDAFGGSGAERMADYFFDSTSP
jgi:hypothetical protein